MKLTQKQIDEIEDDVVGVVRWLDARIYEKGFAEADEAINWLKDIIEKYTRRYKYKKEIEGLVWKTFFVETLKYGIIKKRGKYVYINLNVTYSIVIAILLLLVLILPSNSAVGGFLFIFIILTTMIYYVLTENRQD